VVRPSNRPAFSEQAARALIAEHYAAVGELADVASLPSYIDRNFRIDAAAGRYVLKIASAQTSRSEMEFECAAMEALAEAELELATPKLVASAHGRTLVEVVDSVGHAHVARLVSFVPGGLLADHGRPSDELLFDLGRKLALADRALARVDHPARTRSLEWDLARSAWIADHTHRISGADRRALIDDALLQFCARIRPELSSLPRGVIHNDANDYNLTVKEDRIAGLFDFGDMVETCSVFEPVIASTYAAFHRPDDPVAAICEVAAGYHGVRKLEARELELFFECVRTRLAISLVSSARAAEQDPENQYASVSETNAWTLLDQLSLTTPAALADQIRERCGVSPAPTPPIDREQLIADRRQRLGGNLGLSYDEPLWIRRGAGTYLFDETGRAYLDCVNNVCHVGHCHPRVVAAASRQMAQLNTNTRYLHEGILEYSERLLATFPDHLEVCFLVCSGSEANELALRLARAHTGHQDLLVLDHAYHGNTGGLVALSPYKFDGPGGTGRRNGVHVAAAPDPYRDPAASDGSSFAEASISAALRGAGTPVAALLAESLLGCGGQVIPPPGYLARAFELARAHGALAIADEVQVGFGRVGTHMWAFEAQGARPDIVTLGKPIGNGHPLGAVVTTRAIAESFANGMEYFNTFGGNPVSCAVGSAVLAVLEEEGLPEHARATGALLLESLRELQSRHECIGDVRGLGMFIGVELVTDRERKSPAADLASAVVQSCRREGVLLSTDGPLHNVLKIKPPLPFDAVDAGLLVRAVDRALGGVAESA
jgi:4-aminobutyrate aminotransferase-like enzyme/Ser/Thr protein kinase RdoA (MazF antagonist)